MPCIFDALTNRSATGQEVEYKTTCEWLRERRSHKLTSRDALLRDTFFLTSVEINWSEKTVVKSKFFFQKTNISIK